MIVNSGANWFNMAFYLGRVERSPDSQTLIQIKTENLAIVTLCIPVNAKDFSVRLVDVEKHYQLYTLWNLLVIFNLDQIGIPNPNRKVFRSRQKYVVVPLGSWNDLIFFHPIDISQICYSLEMSMKLVHYVFTLTILGYLAATK